MRFEDQNTICSYNTDVPSLFRPVFQSSPVRVLAASFCLLLGIQLPIWAQVPTVAFPEGTLTSPSAAEAYFAPSTTRQNSILETDNPRILVSLADGLGAGRLSEEAFVDSVFQYVSANIETEFRYGVSKGAMGALVDGSGTPFDKAELMAALLQQGGVAASYELGNAMLTPAQFGRWTGLVYGLDEGAQAFSVDAASACRFLAAGGIPAIVNGTTSSDCTYSGVLTQLTMAHVVVSVGGVRYDPSFYEYQLRAPIDLSASMGCGSDASSGCGAGARDALLSGASIGYDSAADARYAQGLNAAALDNYVTARASALQSHIEAIEASVVGRDAGVQIEAIVGGRVRDQSELGRAQATPPYAFSSRRVLSGGFPDLYRTAVRIRYHSIDATYFADEIYGYALGFSTQRTVGPGETPRLYMHLEGDFGGQPIWRTALHDILPSGGSQLTLDIDFPYPGAPTNGGNVGSYLDRSRTFSGNGVGGGELFPNEIILNLGRSGSARTQRASALSSQYPPTPQQMIVCAPPATGAEDDMCKHANGQLLLYTATWAEQNTRAIKIIEEVNQVSAQHHATFGYATQGEGTISGHPGLGTFSIVNAESVLGVTARSGVSADRASGMRTTALAFSALEGGSARQLFDTWIGASAVNLFSLANERNARFYEANGSNLSSILGQVADYGTYSQQLLQAAFVNGRQGVIPREGAVGTYQMTDLTSSIGINVTGLLSYDANGNDISFLATNGAKGAGFQQGIDPLQAALSTLDSQSTEPFEPIHLVSLNNGALSVTPPADLVTGTGVFPQTLSFQRYYSSSATQISSIAWIYAPIVGFHTGRNISPGLLTPGWSHSFDIRANVTSLARRALGSELAVEASEVIAVLRIMRDLNMMAGSVERDMSLVLAGEFLAKELEANGVSVTLPPNSLEFLELADGTWRAGGQSNASLEVLSWSRVRDVLSAEAVYRYDGMNFRVRLEDGSLLNFRSAGDDALSIGASHLWLDVNDFVVDEWSFSNGEEISFNYVTVEHKPSGDTSGRWLRRERLSQVSNSVGETLLFSSGSGYDAHLSVSDGHGRSVHFYRNNDDAHSEIFVDAEGQEWRYEYDIALPPVADVTGTTIELKYDLYWSMLLFASGQTDLEGPIDESLGPNRRLVRVGPIDGSVPHLFRSEYDDLGRVAHVRDGLDQEQDFLIGGVGGEDWVRSRHFDEVDGQSILEFSDGGQTRSVSRRGVEEMVERDGFNRPIERRIRSLMSAAGVYEQRITYSYDVLHNLRFERLHSRTDSSSSPITGEALVTEYQYSDINWPTYPTQMIDPRGRQWTTTYDSATGLPTQYAGPSGELTEFVYDNFGVYSVDSLLEGILFSVDENLTRETRFDYNSNGRLAEVRTQDPTNSAPDLVTSIDYDAVGNIERVVGPEGSESDYEWTSRRWLEQASVNLSSATSDRSTSRFVYNELGQVLESWVARVAAPTTTEPTDWDVTSHEYTDVSKLLRTIDPSGDTQSYTYDAAGRLRTSSDGEGRTVLTTYWPDGLVHNIIEAYVSDEQVVAAQQYYNALGQRRTLRPANGLGANPGVQTANGLYDTLWEFDAYGRVETVRYPRPADGAAQPTESFGYDANSNLTSHTTRAGDVITMVYDASNRLTHKTTPDGTTVTTYNLAGEPVSVTAPDPHVSGNWRLDYAYDFAGRLESETQTTPQNVSRTVSYRYDGAGNRTHIIWPDGYTARYVYDAANRLSEIWVADGPDLTGWKLADYAYDPQGRLVSYITRRGSGGTQFSRMDLSYEPDSDLATLSHDFYSSIPEDVTFTYGYDASGYLISQDSNNATWQWSPATSTAGYQTASYETNRLDQYAAASGTSYSYDLNGNLTSDGLRSFTYSAENQLLTATTLSGGLAEYSYGPAARRVRKTVDGVGTDYLHAGDMEIAEYDSVSGDLLRRYIPGPGVDQRVVMIECGTSANCRATQSGTQTDYYHADRQGNVLAVTRSGADALVQRFSYTPFGVELVGDASGNPFRYTGRRHDPETGLYYYRARYYDPDLGRFLQVDPIGYADQWNLYAYVGNNPLNATDPTGMQSDDSIERIRVHGIRGRGDDNSNQVALVDWISSVFIGQDQLGGPTSEQIEQDIAEAMEAAAEQKAEEAATLVQCAAHATGLDALVGAGLAGSGLNILPARTKMGGGTPGTSLASVVSRRLFGNARFPRGARGWAPTRAAPLATSRSVGTVAGRLGPAAGWLLLMRDAWNTAECTKNGGPSDE